MAKMTKNKNRFFLVILLLAVLFFAGLIILNKHNVQNSNQEITSSLPAIVPNDWKTETDSAKFFGFNTISFSYPKNWTSEKSNYNGGGLYDPTNFRMIFNSNKSQCVRFTITDVPIERNAHTLVQMGSYDWHGGETLEKDIIDQEDFLVDGKSASIGLIDNNHGRFLVGTVDFGGDVRFPGKLKLFAFLVSCSVNEESTFNSIVSSIKIN